MTATRRRNGGDRELAIKLARAVKPYVGDLIEDNDFRSEADLKQGILELLADTEEAREVFIRWGKSQVDKDQLYRLVDLDGMAETAKDLRK